MSEYIIDNLLLNPKRLKASWIKKIFILFMVCLMGLYFTEVATACFHQSDVDTMNANGRAALNSATAAWASAAIAAAIPGGQAAAITLAAIAAGFDAAALGDFAEATYESANLCCPGQ